MNELIPLQDANPATLFAPGGLDPILDAIEREARSLVPDISTAKGRKEVASNAAKVAKAKTYLDDIGKSYVAELKDLPRKIDAARKGMRDRLDALKDEVRRPLTEYEQAEAARVTQIKDALSEISNPPPDGATAAELEARLNELVALNLASMAWDEFEAEAIAVRDTAIDTMKARLEARREYEAIIERNGQLEQERADRERQERERQIAEQAAAAEREKMLRKMVAEDISAVLEEIRLDNVFNEIAKQNRLIGNGLPCDGPCTEPMKVITKSAAMDRLDALDDMQDITGQDTAGLELAERILIAIESGKIANVSASWA